MRVEKIDCFINDILTKHESLRQTMREHHIEENSPAWAALLKAAEAYAESVSHYNALGEF